jgi:hypothetical protein
MSPVHSLDISDNVKGAIFGALSADALCLGSHYEYDAKKIKQAYGGQNIDRFLSPGEGMGGQTHGVGWGARNYHPGKRAGDNTDYGEQNVILMEYLANAYIAGKHAPFSIDDYVKSHWVKQYDGMETGQCRACAAWIDTMCKQTIANLQRGTPLSEAGGWSNGQVVRFAGVCV